ncbi:MAG TPA: ATP-dependent DNA helicase RecG [Candidatus Paceibacterota bacterium]|nr:ATP-dependent DNA helicase RecG [Candidatus Paceibacterota bacterium]
MELNTPLEKILRLGEEQKRALERLDLKTVRDLLFYFPTRYIDIKSIIPIKELKPGSLSTIAGKVTKVGLRKSFRSRIPLGEAEIEDLTGKIKVIWFNQPYIAKIIKIGEFLKLAGTVTEGKQGIYLSNPEFEKAPALPIDTHDSLFEDEEAAWHLPVYPETRGLSSRFIYHAVKKILPGLKIADYIPTGILKKYNLPILQTAIYWIHLPKSGDHAVAARKRFAFEEIFLIQLRRRLDRLVYRKNKSFIIKAKKDEIENFIKRFPFLPTAAQEKVTAEILADLGKEEPMTRLLEGDVGSGKTAVAATIAHAVIKTPPAENKFSHLQVAYMAPTEILAIQHFENFIQYFRHLNINVGLITGTTCKKFPSKVNPHQATDVSRSQLLKWVGSGDIPILLGTHTLIQKSVKFKNLGLVIIDEQHRFGTHQRMALVRKDGFAPHLLSMTATPIPRTLALTIYGDLDLSLLDELPQGRKRIQTEIIPPEKRDGAYEKIAREIEAGRQVYVICPRIDEPDETKRKKLDVKSVKAEAKRLKKNIFPNERIEILHSKINKKEKERVMKEFAAGDITILVATSVIEVGINVPNATVMIIEGAERFGLAQLHQLRGRVGRSEDQAYCFIFAETKSEKTMKRLNALREAKSGFELSELDLALRGPGELAGVSQWGISDIGMEAIKNIKMVEAARREAEIIEKDLAKYPLLKSLAEAEDKIWHFE